MSEAQPPTEFLPIFNPANYPDDARNQGTGSYVNFPTAQGKVIFPDGVVWGDGSSTNSADIPLEDNNQIAQYQEGPYALYWPWSGGSGWPAKGSGNGGLNAQYAWFICFSSSGTGVGYSGFNITLGYYVDQFVDGTNPWMMVSAYPRPNNYYGGGANYDPELTVFQPYNTYGFACIACSADGKIVAALPGRDGTNHTDNYPMGVITTNFGTTVVSATNIGALPLAPSTNPRAYFPQTIQVSASGQYITTCQLQYVSGGLDATSPLDLHQSTDYGVTYSLMLRVNDVLNDFSKATPNLKVQAPHAQSKNGRVICVAYNLGYEIFPGLPSGQSYGMSISISRDYGRTFTQSVNILTYGTYTRWPVPTCMAMSANGQYIYIGYMDDDAYGGQTNGGLLFSDDYGATWKNGQGSNTDPLGITTPYVFTTINQRIAYVQCSNSGMKVICSNCATGSDPNQVFFYSNQGGGVFNKDRYKSFFNLFTDGNQMTLIGVKNGPLSTDPFNNPQQFLQQYYM